MSIASVGGIPFRVTRLEDAAEWAIEAAIDPAAPGMALRFANAYSVASARADQRYADLLLLRGVNFPDGAPVAWTMRRTGWTRARRVRGPSFFAETLRRGTGVGLRHYFFGTSDAVLADMITRIQQQHPGIVVVGSSAPDYRDDPAQLAAQLPAHVTKDTVDIVWVGLGAPKQDFVAETIASERGVLTAGVGAAFDFVAGSVVEAPRLVQDTGLEWLFRLASEPRRLWRRYLLGNAVFLGAVLPQVLFGQRQMRRSTTVRRPLRVDAGRAHQRIDVEVLVPRAPARR